MEAQNLLDRSFVGVYPPETLAVVQKAFNDAWAEIVHQYGHPAAI